MKDFTVGSTNARYFKWARELAQANWVFLGPWFEPPALNVLYVTLCMPGQVSRWGLIVLQDPSCTSGSSFDLIGQACTLSQSS